MRPGPCPVASAPRASHGRRRRAPSCPWRMALKTSGWRTRREMSFGYQMSAIIGECTPIQRGHERERAPSTFWHPWCRGGSTRADLEVARVRAPPRTTPHHQRLRHDEQVEQEAEQKVLVADRHVRHVRQGDLHREGEGGHREREESRRCTPSRRAPLDAEDGERERDDDEDGERHAHDELLGPPLHVEAEDRFASSAFPFASFSSPK